MLVVVVLTYAMLGGPSTYFERSARAPARAENVIFHKGNGLETPSSEFSGLRMRDGVLPLLLYPVRGLTEYSLKLMGPTPQGGGVPPRPLGPGAGGGRTWGENGPFWTNFLAPGASRGRNPANGKTHPRTWSYLSNAGGIGGRGG